MEGESVDVGGDFVGVLGRWALLVSLFLHSGLVFAADEFLDLDCPDNALPGLASGLQECLRHPAHQSELEEETFRAIAERLMDLATDQASISEVMHHYGGIPAAPARSYLKSKSPMRCQLTPLEQTVLSRYTSSTFAALEWNAYWRGEFKPAHLREPAMTDVRKVLRRALRKFPVYRGAVLRATRLNDDDVRRLFPVGATVTLNAVTSTSMSPEGVGAFGAQCWLIHSKEGRDLAAFGGAYLTEREVAFPPGTKFQVLKFSPYDATAAGKVKAGMCDGLGGSFEEMSIRSHCRSFLLRKDACRSLLELSEVP